MANFPWQHIQGHLVAEVLAETADEVTINYQHVSVIEWGGVVTMSKPVFFANYSNPTPLQEAEKA